MKSMNLLFTVSALCVCVGCGGGGGSSNSPAQAKQSILAGKDIYFVYGEGGSDYTATYYIDVGGTFTASETYPNNCALDGTWVDHNPGSDNGTVTLNVQSDGCNPVGDNQSVTFNYVYANGVIDFSY